MPGVTKNNSWLKTPYNLLLLDTPGILWPKLEGETGYNLASMTAIKNEILPIEDVAIYILNTLYKYYPNILKERYNLDDISDIEEVDYIWTGGSYADLTGKKNHYDYIIASHITEHTCDLIGFLNDCSEILKENGILSLAIPDKRFCFDYLRPVTSISKIIDSHINKSSVHTPGSVYEHVSNTCKSYNDIAWTYPHPPVMMNPVHNIDNAINTYKKSLDQNEYIDVHNWVFTKNSFEFIIYDLNCLKLIDLQTACCFDTDDHEFFISLIKSKEPFIPDDEEHFKLAVKAHHEFYPNESEDDFMKNQAEAFKDQIIKKETQIKMMENQISSIYNSKTWKTGSKIQKLFNLFKTTKR